MFLLTPQSGVGLIRGHWGQGNIRHKDVEYMNLYSGLILWLLHFDSQEELSEEHTISLDQIRYGKRNPQ
jgi:hypothetical protein